MDFEDMLLDIGEYGKYQKNLIWIFLFPVSALLPWFSMKIQFMVSVPQHWCYVSEVASSHLNISQQRSFISPPDSPSCSMYDINYTHSLYYGIASVSNESTTRPCTEGWQYDKTGYESTAATQWNLVCDDAHYTSLVLTLYNVGSIIGTPIYGLLSDRIGRRIVFFIVIIVTSVTGFASVLMTNFTAFLVIKTINGSLMPSIFQLPYIIVLEIVSPEMRSRMNAIVNISWTLGLCVLPLVAYLSRTWITLGLVTNATSLILFFYWKFLPESPRWLVSMGRYEEAAVVMFDIAEKNGKLVDKAVLLQKLQKLGQKMNTEKEVDGIQNSATDLLRYPQLRKTFIIITICWMANIMAYYGLQLNVSNLAGNEFLNFFLLAIVELPGYLSSWYVMESLGRRWCAAGCFILTGIVCMLPAAEFPYGDVICSMIGKYFAAATFLATYQQSSELYPTVVRSIGMGMSSTVAFMATLVVPYLVYLSVYGKGIPFFIIGSSSLLAGVLAMFLPETINENLPQTINDAEEFGRNHKFFSYKRRRQSLCRERKASNSEAGKADKLCKLQQLPPETKTIECISKNDTYNIKKKSDAFEDKGSLRQRHAVDNAGKELHVNLAHVNDSESGHGEDNFTHLREMQENASYDESIVSRNSDVENQLQVKDAKIDSVGDHVAMAQQMIKDSTMINDAANEPSRYHEGKVLDDSKDSNIQVNDIRNDPAGDHLNEILHGSKVTQHFKTGYSEGNEKY